MPFSKTFLSTLVLLSAATISVPAQAEYGLKCKRYAIDVTEAFCDSATGLCTTGRMTVGKSAKAVVTTSFRIDNVFPGALGPTTMGYTGLWSAQGRKGSVSFQSNGFMDGQ